MISQNGLDYYRIKEITLDSEMIGFDSVWLHDHLFFDSQTTFLECWTLLSALSSITTKIRLGTLVLCNSYRSPSLLAKMAATLDVLSNGRLEFGIGGGWHEQEHTAYGFAFSPAITRLRRLDESLQVIKKLWIEDKANFDGKYFSLKNAICNPKPVQVPHPPIWIGGTETFLLKLVAKHANGCNFRGFNLSPNAYHEKLVILKDFCESVGRDFGTLQKSFLASIVVGKTQNQVSSQLKQQKKSFKHILSLKNMSQAIQHPKHVFDLLTGSKHLTNHSVISGNVDDCIEKIQEYVDVGVSYFMFSFPNYDTKTMNFFAENILSAFKN